MRERRRLIIGTELETVSVSGDSNSMLHWEQMWLNSVHFNDINYMQRIGFGSELEIRSVCQWTGWIPQNGRISTPHQSIFFLSFRFLFSSFFSRKSIYGVKRWRIGMLGTPRTKHAIFLECLTADSRNCQQSNCLAAYWFIILQQLKRTGEFFAVQWRTAIWSKALFGTRQLITLFSLDNFKFIHILLLSCFTQRNKCLQQWHPEREWVMNDTNHSDEMVVDEAIAATVFCVGVELTEH